ncbi:MAG: AAA family ATPase [Smithellaceae bacterium]|nr:AAA family ATPase [Smithellaceae bacterium]
MKILVVVGMPASGKNIARDYAQERAIPYFSTGDLVRAEVNRRGVEPNAENTAIVSTELRGDDGMGVTRIAVATALKAKAPLVFIEGMRSWPEIELIRRHSPCTVVAFLAPVELRKQRIVQRGRTDYSASAFHQRDAREISYGTAIPLALADEYILNAGTMDEALKSLDGIVKRLAAAQDGI